MRPPCRQPTEACTRPHHDMNENPARPAKEDRHFVTALARGMEVLACFRAGDRLHQPITNQETIDVESTAH